MNFDDITGKVKKIGQDTMAEFQKMNEIRQLNASISFEKKKIRSEYLEMGRKLYDHYRENPPKEFESEFAAIGASFDSIEDLRRRIRSVKEVALCPNCKAEVGINEKFCSNCGCRMPEAAVEDAEETVVEAEAEEAAEERAAAEAEEAAEEQAAAETAEAEGEQAAAETAEAEGEQAAVKAENAADEPAAAAESATGEQTAVETEEASEEESAATPEKAAEEQPDASESLDDRAEKEE